MQPELPLLLSARAHNTAWKRTAAGPCMSPGSGFVPLQHRCVKSDKVKLFVKGRQSKGVNWEAKKGMGRAWGLERGREGAANREGDDRSYWSFPQL